MTQSSRQGGAMKKRFVLAALIALPSMVSAQWSTVPDGTVSLTMNINPGSGSFSCQIAAYYLPGGSCSASGNTMRLTNGAAWADLTYTPLAVGPVTATNRTSVVFAYGQVSVQTGGVGEFLWPSMMHNDITLFGLGVSFSVDGNASQGISVQWVRANTTTLADCCGGLYFVPLHDAGPLPSYGSVIDGFSDEIITLNGPNIFSANLHVVPEPSTYALMGLGMAGLLWVRRRIWKI
jgi:hypothetical protein